MTATRHFLDVDDLSCDELDAVLSMAALPVAEVPQVLAGRGAALVFEKPSARTRSSTELAVVALGGHPVYIQGAEVGIDHRETAEDVARTLACFHAVLCARVLDHERARAHGGRPGAARRPTGPGHGSTPGPTTVTTTGSRRRCRWSTCSRTGPIPVRRWPTC